MSGNDRERLRQQALMRALFMPDEGPALKPWVGNGPERVQRALQAYQATAGASAERTLASTFPTVLALVGEASFGDLARALWHAQPPQRGDLTYFGDALPVFIEASDQLASVPYLADVARLDALVASAEHAADDEADIASLNLMMDSDPAQIRLVLAPGAAVLCSQHPVVSVWLAHQPGDEQALRIEEAKAALAVRRAECALVWRRGWRAHVQRVDAAVARWTLALVEDQALSHALDGAGEAFAFEPWLAQALKQGWLLRAERLS